MSCGQCIGMMELSALLVLAFLTAPGHAIYLYFTPSKGAEKCFWESLSPGERFYGYVHGVDLADANRVLAKNGEDPIAFQVKVKNPRGVYLTDDAAQRNTKEDLMQMTFSPDDEIRFEFAAPADGLVTNDYQICITTKGECDHSDVELHIEFGFKTVASGNSIPVPGDLAKEEHLNDISVRLGALVDEMGAVDNKLAQYRILGTQVRGVAESNNSRVGWLSIAQTAIMFIIGSWQIWHLRRFFLRRSII